MENNKQKRCGEKEYAKHQHASNLKQKSSNDDYQKYNGSYKRLWQCLIQDNSYTIHTIGNAKKYIRLQEALKAGLTDDWRQAKPLFYFDLLSTAGIRESKVHSFGHFMVNIHFGQYDRKKLHIKILHATIRKYCLV